MSILAPRPVDGHLDQKFRFRFDEVLEAFRRPRHLAPALAGPLRVFARGLDFFEVPLVQLPECLHVDERCVRLVLHDVVQLGLRRGEERFEGGACGGVVLLSEKAFDQLRDVVTGSVRPHPLLSLPESSNDRRKKGGLASLLQLRSIVQNRIVPSS